MKQARVSLALLITGMLIGSFIGFGVSVLNNHSVTTIPSETTSSSRTVTSGTSSNSEVTCQPNSTGTTGVISTANYPSNLFQFVVMLMDQNVTLPGSVVIADYDSLFSPSFFNEQSSLDFDFQFVKNQYFKPEMYGGQFNNSLSWLTYPTHILMGTEGGLLFVYAQVLYIYGFGEVNNMLPGPLNSSYALEYGNVVQTPEGFYVYAFQSWYTRNQTYYVGPATVYYSAGNGTYDSLTSYNNTGFYWGGSVILGSYREPLMTRYLYVINMTRLPQVTEGCRKIEMMFSLYSILPFGLNTGGSFFDFYPLIDNYPSHSLYGPFNYSKYLEFYLRS